MRKSIVSLLTIVVAACCTTADAVPITGGTGPGGFIATGPLSDLTLWLRGDAGITQDGANRVSNWADQSGHSNDVAQGTLNQQPLQNASINGTPVVTFDGGGAAAPDQMISTSPVLAQSIFVANQTQGFHSCCNPIVGNQNSFISIRYSGANWDHPGDANDFTNPGGSTFRVNGAVGTAAPQNVTHFLHAERANQFNFTNLKLAQHNGFADRAWEGQMGEVVVFNRALTSVERILVDNYLSAKFNIPLNTGSGALDRYEGDTPANGDFDLDVFGIGNDGVSSVTTAGSEGFGIEQAGGTLGTGEFVLAGHNVQTNSLITENGIQRWDRSWFVDKTDTDGIDATFAFDFTDAGLAAPAFGITDVPVLLFRDDLGDDFSAIAGSSSIIGDTVIFSVPNALLQDGFFTLGIAQIPEPSTFALIACAGVVGLRVRRRRM